MNHNIEQFTLDIITNYFPELNNVRIKIRYIKGKRFFCSILRVPFYGFILSYTKSVSELNEYELKAVLAHELAHVLQMNKISFLLKSEIAIEREADQIVIDRGLGSNLYAFLKYHDKHYRKYKKSDGLTKKEVKAKLKATII